MAIDKFLVEASHIMMFARSIADGNEIYYDEEYAASTEPGRVIAPPTFAQSSAQFDPDYFLRPKIGEDWFGSGKEATGIKREAGRGGGGGGESWLNRAQENSGGSGGDSGGRRRSTYLNDLIYWLEVNAQI